MQYTVIIIHMHSAVGNGTEAPAGLLLVALLWTPSSLQKETPTSSQTHGYLSARSWQGAAVQEAYMRPYDEIEFITQ